MGAQQIGAPAHSNGIKRPVFSKHKVSPFSPALRNTQLAIPASEKEWPEEERKWLIWSLPASLAGILPRPDRLLPLWAVQGLSSQSSSKGVAWLLRMSIISECQGSSRSWMWGHLPWRQRQASRGRLFRGIQGSRRRLVGHDLERYYRRLLMGDTERRVLERRRRQ